MLSDAGMTVWFAFLWLGAANAAPVPAVEGKAVIRPSQELGAEEFARREALVRELYQEAVADARDPAKERCLGRALARQVDPESMQRIWGTLAGEAPELEFRPFHRSELGAGVKPTSGRGGTRVPEYPSGYAPAGGKSFVINAVLRPSPMRWQAKPGGAGERRLVAETILHELAHIATGEFGVDQANESRMWSLGRAFLNAAESCRD